MKPGTIVKEETKAEGIVVRVSARQKPAKNHARRRARQTRGRAHFKALATQP